MKREIKRQMLLLIAVKETTRWRRVGRGSENRKRGSSDTQRNGQRRQSKTTTELASEQQALERWEEAWSNEETERKLYSTCPNTKKQIVKINISLYSALNALVAQIRTERIGLKKFLHPRKLPGFDSSKCPCRQRLQSATHALIGCRSHTGEGIGFGRKMRIKADLEG